MINLSIKHYATHMVSELEKVSVNEKTYPEKNKNRLLHCHHHLKMFYQRRNHNCNYDEISYLFKYIRFSIRRYNQYK